MLEFVPAMLTFTPPAGILLGGPMRPHLGRPIMSATLDQLESAVAEEASEITSFASDGIFADGVLEGLLSSESGWVLLLAGVVLVIGQSFETVKHVLEHRLPKPLLPVLEAVLSEMTTVGFSGLMIGAAEGSGLLENTLSPLSQQWLGDPKLLLEIFEAVDAGLFPTIVAFGTASTKTQAVRSPKLRSLACFPFFLCSPACLSR